LNSPVRRSAPINFKEVLQQQLIQQLHERKFSAPAREYVSSPHEEKSKPSENGSNKF
jgi:hypothetical protein